MQGSVDPNYASAYSNRGAAYYQQGDQDRAIADFRDVLRISDDPNERQYAEEQLERFGIIP